MCGWREGYFLLVFLLSSSKQEASQVCPSPGQGGETTCAPHCPTATMCLQYTFSKCLMSVVIFPCALHDTCTLQTSLHYNCLRKCVYVLGNVRSDVTWNSRDMFSWTGAPSFFPPWCSREWGCGVGAFGGMPWTSTYPGHSHPMGFQQKCLPTFMKRHA